MVKNIIWTVIVVFIIGFFSLQYSASKYVNYERKLLETQQIQEEELIDVRELVESYNNNQKHVKDSLINSLVKSKETLRKEKRNFHVVEDSVKHEIDSLKLKIKNLIEENDWYGEHITELYQEIDVLNSLNKSYETLLDSIYNNPVIPDTIIDTVYVNKPMIKSKILKSKY